MDRFNRYNRRCGTSGPATSCTRTPLQGVEGRRTVRRSVRRHRHRPLAGPNAYFVWFAQEPHYGSCGEILGRRKFQRPAGLPLAAVSSRRPRRAGIPPSKITVDIPVNPRLAARSFTWALAQPAGAAVAFAAGSCAALSRRSWRRLIGVAFIPLITDVVAGAAAAGAAASSAPASSASFANVTVNANTVPRP